MTVSIWQDRSSEMIRDVDVAVVGAGLLGCAIARDVCRLGRTVAVLEARSLAAGATGRNLGLVQAGLSQPYHEVAQRFGSERARELFELTLENRLEILQVVRRHDLSVERCGSYALASDEAQLAELTRSADLLHEDGFKVRVLPADPLGRGFKGALHWADDMALDPMRLAESLFRESRAILFEGCEVFALVPQAEYVTLYARRGTFRARHVFVAANAYAPQLDSYFARLVQPRRVQVLATEPLPRLCTLFGDLDGGRVMFRQLPDGRLMVAGGPGSHAPEESTFADHTTPDVQASLEDFVSRHFPEAMGKITRRWAGTMGWSPDGVPVVGQLQADPRICFVLGFARHGLSLALVAARRAVALAFQGVPAGLLDVTRVSTEPRGLG